ncbi:hypothetical protein PS422_08695, partial [Limosilactobacillus fermentum]
ASLNSWLLLCRKEVKMAKVQNEMATRITVDTVQAANSMQAMRQAISANTNAWKAIKNQPFCDRILSSTGE